MPRKQYRNIVIGAAVLLILIILLAVRLGRRDGTPETLEAPADTAQGVVYLQSLEAGDPDRVDTILKTQHLQKLEALREERLRQLDSGEISVWSLFEDYVLLGDSRAVGFYFYDYLPESRVLADAGDKIIELEEHIPDIQQLNPSTVFLCYGINDVGIGIWPTPEDYVADYSRIIGEIQDAVPGVTVYLSSILPARDPAFDSNPDWRNIPQYNLALDKMCSEIDGCYFVNCDQLAEDYAEYYEVDGVHFQLYFYPHWAANLITEVYSSQLDW